MGTEKLNVDSIYLAAIEISNDAQRIAYLDEARGGDNDLRHHVERLLRAQSKVGSFLESPAPELEPTVNQPVTERPGSQIGPYKLMEQIGEGGMGLVFVAQQEQPLRRKVALKIIKPGMDTREVIYSLGVLLYELLTGSTPFDKARMQEVAFQEMRRIVCEEESPRPSTKISTLGDSVTDVSTRRATDPRGLSKFITGDLDVIVMKAIEKDRTRRYETASGLADDVERFLEDQPIVARAPSITYRLSKFVRRNRMAMATTALVLLSLVLGLAGVTWGWKQASQRTADLVKKNTELNSLAESYRSELVGRTLIEAMRASPEARQLLSKAQTAKVEPLQLEMLRGQLELYSGHPEDAVRHLRAAIKIASEGGTQCVAAESMLTIAYLHSGRLWDQIIQSCKVDSLPLGEPVDPYDCLFKAQGYIASPRRGLEILDRGYPVDQAQTALSLAVRAELHAWSGVTYNALEDSRTAIEYSHAARLLLGDTPFALQVDLLAHASMITVARKQEMDWESHYAEACSIASVLRTKFPQYAWGGEVRSFHCLAAGDLAGAEQALLDASAESDSPFYRTSVAMVRYQSDAADMVSTAHEVLRKMRSSWDKSVIAQCLTDTPDGRDMTRAIRAEILAKVDNDPQLLSDLAMISLVLGESERAKEEAQRALREARIESESTSNWLAWSAQVNRFLAEEIDAEELLRLAKPHGNRQSEAYLVIGRWHLANHDIETARRNLDLAIEHGFP